MPSSRGARTSRRSTQQSDKSALAKSGEGAKPLPSRLQRARPPGQLGAEKGATPEVPSHPRKCRRGKHWKHSGGKKGTPSLLRGSYFHALRPSARVEAGLGSPRAATPRATAHWETVPSPGPRDGRRGRPRAPLLALSSAGTCAGRPRHHSPAP